MATVKRVPAMTLQIWQDLLKPRGFELQEGKLVRSPSKSQAPPRVVLDPFESPSKNKRKTRAVPLEKDDGDAVPGTKPSVIASFRRTQSTLRKPEDASTQRRPFKRVLTTNDGPPVASSSSALEQRCQLFQGRIFRAMGEARCPSVREAIEQAGGTLVSEGSDEEVDFIIVRLVRSVRFIHQPDEYLTLLYTSVAASFSGMSLMFWSEPSSAQSAGWNDVSLRSVSVRPQTMCPLSRSWSRHQ